MTIFEKTGDHCRPAVSFSCIVEGVGTWRSHQRGAGGTQYRREKNEHCGEGERCDDHGLTLPTRARSSLSRASIRAASSSIS